MLTKSDFIRYLQCYKYLWLYKNRKDLIPPEYEERFAQIFGEGFKVEDYAYKLFPNGQDAYDEDFKTAISKSKDLISKKTLVIFQPTISGRELFSRADIIKYNPKKDCWDIYEIKGSVSVKDLYIADLAFQKVCLETNGLKLGKLFIIHVNKAFVKKGEIKPEKFLTIAEITQEVDDLVKETRKQIKEALLVLQKAQEPQIRILKQCSDPYECMFTDYCWKDVPANSIYNLAGRLSEEKLEHLLDEGIISIKDIPEGFLKSQRAILHHQAVKHNIVHLEKEEIKKDLAKLQYPLYFLDYETYGFSAAVPLFDGYHPYQNMPFQYSVHVLPKPKAKLQHYEFLADKYADPALDLAKALSKIIKSKGNVIAWNASFEMGCNEEMGKRYPKYKKFFQSVNKRMYDLMMIFRNGYYVHKDFQGSASLKKVLPVLVPKLSYQKLNIHEGGTASDSWREMIEPISPNLVDKHALSQAEGEKGQIYNDLLKYCELDTLAMVEILKALEKVILG